MTARVDIEHTASLAGTRTGALVVGWAGVLSVVLAFFPPFLLTGEIDQPTWTDQPDVVAGFYQDLAFGGAFAWGVVLEGLAFLLFLVFIARLAEIVGDIDGGSRWVGRLIFGGAVVEQAVGIFGYLVPLAAAVSRASHGGVDAAGYIALHDLRFGYYWVSLLIAPVYMIPLGVGIIRTRRFSVWLGWALIINAVAILASLGLGYGAWNATTGLTFLWFLILAAAMVRSPGRYATAEAS